MFIKNANLQNPRRHQDFFLPDRPYRGEPPTVAGFLLYPDTPAKMETTTQEAFCFRPADRGKGEQKTQQESQRSPSSSSTQTGRGSGSRDLEPGEDEHGGRAVTGEPDVTEMRSQYQKDFPPPTSRRRRRTPALPQPDNLGINPAFRIDFSTVQREHFPGWPVTDPGRPRERLSPDRHM